MSKYSLFHICEYIMFSSMNQMKPGKLQPADMRANAADAAAFLKSLAQEHRLMILCLLCDSERSVGELATLLDVRQPTLSQHLARLRAEGLVKTRRDGTTVFYALADNNVRPIVKHLYATFCAP